MKLGGLTWWRNNYGSMLQAFALQTVVNSIDNVKYEIICQYGKKVISTSNLVDKLKRFGLTKTLKKIFWKFTIKGLRNRNIKIQHFIDQHLLISDIQYTEDTIGSANAVYDGFISGSDQVWNTALVGANEMYWQGFASDDKLKIAYAPSVGVTEFPSNDIEILQRNLKRFTALSTREESGTKLINSMIESERAVTVLDPTLLVSKIIWDEMSEEPLYREKYIFVYMLRGTMKQRRFIEEYARINKCKIVTMPFLDPERIELYDFIFGDVKLWDADPAEFIKAIRYSEMVFTDSFHSMVFSCIYHRSFYVFPKIGKAQLGRITEFQKQFGIKSRLINDSTTIEDVMKMTPIDWDTFDRKLSEKREFSMNYLYKAILQ